MEWGCMQALIDYEGWREWKSYSQPGAGGGDDLLGRRGKAKKTRAAAMNSSSSGDQ
jgi:osomolarity two-component system response regulator SSK1